MEELLALRQRMQAIERAPVAAVKHTRSYNNVASSGAFTGQGSVSLLSTSRAALRQRSLCAAAGVHGGRRVRQSETTAMGARSLASDGGQAVVAATMAPHSSGGGVADRTRHSLTHTQPAPTASLCPPVVARPAFVDYANLAPMPVARASVVTVRAETAGSETAGKSPRAGPRRPSDAQNEPLTAPAQPSSPPRDKRHDVVVDTNVPSRAPSRRPTAGTGTGLAEVSIRCDEAPQLTRSW